ncbi:hypothetical protein LDENG_00026380, partial [Lucifuga dentata]
DWPAPASRKELQRFLGFANFYRCFIQNYSSLAVSLYALTSRSTPFLWSSQANKVFQNLKERFTSAPILTQPDPTRQFIVEVDASDVGVGAVLSQRSPVDHKVHPCAYFSHKFLPAEKNYDVGNRELLAVKLALEEWRHWLERWSNLSSYGLVTRTWSLALATPSPMLYLACSAGSPPLLNLLTSCQRAVLSVR